MEPLKLNASELMQQHITACKASGKTVELYCKENQLKPSYYYYWRKKLQPQQPGKFISIAPLYSNAPVSIIFAVGHRINFESLPPVEYLKQLMS
jgi:hypothetical protein